MVPTMRLQALPEAIVVGFYFAEHFLYSDVGFSFLLEF